MVKRLRPVTFTSTSEPILIFPEYEEIAKRFVGQKVTCYYLQHVEVANVANVISVLCFGQFFPFSSNISLISLIVVLFNALQRQLQDVLFLC